MTDISKPPGERDQASQLVDRVQRELARRRALAEALRGPQRRPGEPAGAPIAVRAARRTS